MRVACHGWDVRTYHVNTSANTKSSSDQSLSLRWLNSARTCAAAAHTYTHTYTHTYKHTRYRHTHARTHTIGWGPSHTKGMPMWTPPNSPAHAPALKAMIMPMTRMHRLTCTRPWPFPVYTVGVVTLGLRMSRSLVANFAAMWLSAPALGAVGKRCVHSMARRTFHLAGVFVLPRPRRASLPKPHELLHFSLLCMLCMYVCLCACVYVYVYAWPRQRRPAQHPRQRLSGSAPGRHVLHALQPRCVAHTLQTHSAFKAPAASCWLSSYVGATHALAGSRVATRSSSRHESMCLCVCVHAVISPLFKVPNLFAVGFFATAIGYGTTAVLTRVRAVRYTGLGAPLRAVRAVLCRRDGVGMIEGRSGQTTNVVLMMCRVCAWFELGLERRHGGRGGDGHPRAQDLHRGRRVPCGFNQHSLSGERHFLLELPWYALGGGRAAADGFCVCVALQLISGVVEQRVLDKVFAKQPLASRTGSFIVRSLNTYLGSALMIEWLKFLVSE